MCPCYPMGNLPTVVRFTALRSWGLLKNSGCSGSLSVPENCSWHVRRLKKNLRLARWTNIWTWMTWLRKRLKSAHVFHPMWCKTGSLSVIRSPSNVFLLSLIESSATAHRCLPFVQIPSIHWNMSGLITYYENTNGRQGITNLQSSVSVGNRNGFYSWMPLVKSLTQKNLSIIETNRTISFNSSLPVISRALEND